MLKSLIFRNHNDGDENLAAALQAANDALMNRVTQVLQTTARNQEKFSTLTRLQPLHH
jgi:hypothetical protein